MSWKRIACARAFSSDMWLTPKNWLSPNSRRSIIGLRSRPGRGLGASRRIGRGSREAALAGAARGAALGVAAAVGAPLPASAIIIAITRSVTAALAKSFAPSIAAALDAVDEVVDLRAVLLAAQVEADRLGQLGRVADVPARARSRSGGVRRLAQVDLALLAVGVDPARRCPRR